MPGVFYTLLTSGGTVFWSLIGPSIVLSLPFTENWCRIVIFLIWESVIFLPWLILCRNKYKVSEPGFSRIGISGIFTQLSFLIGIALMLTKEKRFSHINLTMSGARFASFKSVFNFTQRIFPEDLSKEQGQKLFPSCKMLAISVSAGLFYDFFKTISGDEVEKLRIYAIVIHRSGLSC